MINGVISVRKEKGYTSHDVVAKLRGILGQKKIGHTGTLDPDATGVLPVCLGKATKLCDLLTEKDKTYETVLLLGKTTDTQDISGTVLEEKDTAGLTGEEVEKAVFSFEGNYDQIPPMYSALKVGGKKLYELAREGITVERKARPVIIHKIEILNLDLPRVRMRVTCSKGTYIRTLCQDIGEKLLVGGCMEELVRTQVERFVLEESHTLDEIRKAKEEGTLGEFIIPVDEMFRQYPARRVLEQYEKTALNGGPVPQEGTFSYDLETDLGDGEKIRMYDQKEIFIGLYEYEREKRNFRLIRMFRDRDERA